MQRQFSKSFVLPSLLLLAAVVAAHRLFAGLPDRQTLGTAEAQVRLEPVDLDRTEFGPFELAGAWRVTGDDPRLTGFSALAADRGQLVAVTDSGVVVRLPKPGNSASKTLVRELPAGPGDPDFKRNRDSEAVLRDPSGRGWWIAFEYRDELWLYDRSFSKALRRVKLLGTGWGRNAGLEALAAHGQDLLLLPETRPELLRLDPNGRIRKHAVHGLNGRVSDAVSLAGGALLLVERRLTPLGFRNALVRIAPAEGAYRVTGRTELPLGPLYNVEGVGLDQTAEGRPRLWLVTDDGHKAGGRTMLLALELAAPG